MLVRRAAGDDLLRLLQSLSDPTGLPSGAEAGFATRRGRGGHASSGREQSCGWTPQGTCSVPSSLIVQNIRLLTDQSPPEAILTAATTGVAATRVDDGRVVDLRRLRTGRGWDQR